MADNVTINKTTVAGGQAVATDDIGGVQHQKVKVEFGGDDVAIQVSSSNPLPVDGSGVVQPVSGPLTDTELRANPIIVDGSGVTQPISGSISVTGSVTTTGLTDAELRASDIGVSVSSLPLPSGASTEAKQDTQIAGLASIDSGIADITTALTDGSVHVIVDSSDLPSGGATESKQDTGNASLASIDSKLTNPLPVSGTVTTGGLTDAQLRATAVPVSGPLTDAQLRATAVPISGTVTASGPLTDTQLRATAVPVSGPLTDIQLRATAVPISAASLPLPSGAATDTKQDTGNTSLASIDGKITAVNTGAVVVSSGSITVSGTVTASGPLTDTQLRASAVPVSGTVTANIGTSGSLALDATLTGGTTKAIARGGAKGATTAADLTGTAEGTDHQALDVQIYHGGTAKDPTAIRALTSADSVTAVQGTAAAIGGAWPTKVTDGTNSGTVKAASTAPVLTDTALVTADVGELVDNAGFTDGTSRVLPSGFIFDEVAGTSLTENDVGAARMDAKRAQVGVIEDGTTRSQKASVKAASTAPTLTDGALVVADLAQLVDNAGFTDGTSRVIPAGFIFDETAGTALTENDVAAARIDSKRATVGIIEDATTRGQKAAVTAGGALRVQQKASSATVTQVASSATNVTLKTSNTARVGIKIYNDSNAILYAKFGTTASTTSYTVQIASQGFFEDDTYTGNIDGIWAAANGNAYVTEMVE